METYLGDKADFSKIQRVLVIKLQHLGDVRNQLMQTVEGIDRLMAVDTQHDGGAVDGPPTPLDEEATPE